MIWFRSSLGRRLKDIFLILFKASDVSLKFIIQSFALCFLKSSEYPTLGEIATGVPAATASKTTVGETSNKDGKISKSIARQKEGTLFLSNGRITVIFFS